MLSALIEFIHRLRDAAIPISMVEALDATQSLRHIDLSSRAELRAALEAALVKRAEHRASFAALFDVYFASRRTVQSLAVCQQGCGRARYRRNAPRRPPVSGRAAPPDRRVPPTARRRDPPSPSRGQGARGGRRYVPHADRRRRLPRRNPGPAAGNAACDPATRAKARRANRAPAL